MSGLLAIIEKAVERNLDFLPDLRKRALAKVYFGMARRMVWHGENKKALGLVVRGIMLCPDAMRAYLYLTHNDATFAYHPCTDLKSAGLPSDDGDRPL